MTDEYDEMGRDELLVRVKDWRQVAQDMSAEIRRLAAIIEAAQIRMLDHMVPCHQKNCPTCAVLGVVANLFEEDAGG